MIVYGVMVNNNLLFVLVSLAIRKLNDCSFLVVPKPKKITEKVVNYFFGKLVMVGPYDSRDNGKRYEFLQKYCEVSTANGKACELEHMTGSLNGKNGFHLMVLQFSEAEKLDIIHLIGEEAKAAAEKVEKAAAQKAEAIKAAVKTAKEAREAAKVAREKAEAIKVALKTA